jgi:hypothetical protein
MEQKPEFLKMDKRARPVAMSLIFGHLHPGDRRPHEVSGYYWDFIIHEEYPLGAAIALRWTVGADGYIVTAPPVHASEMVEAIITEVNGDMSLLPDVTSLIFTAVQKAHLERIANL